MTSAITMSSTGEKVFAGPIDDPFFVDLGGIFDLGNFRKEALARDGLQNSIAIRWLWKFPFQPYRKMENQNQQSTSILDPEICNWSLGKCQPSRDYNI